jgi:hypothetical protein
MKLSKLTTGSMEDLRDRLMHEITSYPKFRGKEVRIFNSWFMKEIPEDSAFRNAVTIRDEAMTQE